MGGAWTVGIAVAGTERKVGTGQDWKGPYWQARMRKMWISGVGRGMAR